MYYHNAADALAAAKVMKCKTLGDMQMQVFFVRVCSSFVFLFIVRIFCVLISVVFDYF